MNQCFVRLTHLSGGPVWVNLAWIEAITLEGAMGTKLEVGGAQAVYYRVRETPEQIMACIPDATNPRI